MSQSVPPLRKTAMLDTGPGFLESPVLRGPPETVYRSVAANPTPSRVGSARPTVGRSLSPSHTSEPPPGARTPPSVVALSHRQLCVSVDFRALRIYPTTVFQELHRHEWLGPARAQGCVGCWGQTACRSHPHCPRQPAGLSPQSTLATATDTAHASPQASSSSSPEGQIPRRSQPL